MRSVLSSSGVRDGFSVSLDSDESSSGVDVVSFSEPSASGSVVLSLDVRRESQSASPCSHSSTSSCWVRPSSRSSSSLDVSASAAAGSVGSRSVSRSDCSAAHLCRSSAAVPPESASAAESSSSEPRWSPCRTRPSPW
ncbi:hypothetical protein BJF90_40240 [Pseudonocardia sp. CNS-004]|nr:hypothetical protein BJF90_40240 [Pseudonocardia sp. CNS-004]